jgi:hypothetical protein
MSNITDARIKAHFTAEECMQLAKNAEDRGNSDLADKARYRAAELRAEADIKAGRRPDIDYHFMGLKNGEKLLIREIGEEAEVFTHRTLLYKGSEIYITPLEEYLIKAGHPRKLVVGRWEVESTGGNLGDLYISTYGPKIE